MSAYVNVEEKLLTCAPALHNTSKKCLLKIISNIWPKAIDHVTEIPIREESYLGDFHKSLDHGKDSCQ